MQTRVQESADCKGTFDYEYTNKFMKAAKWRQRSSFDLAV